MANEMYAKHRVITEDGQGIGIRTPIRLGQTLEKTVNLLMRDFRLVKQETSPAHILYLYSRAISEKWISFILFIGTRFAGKITIEIGLSRRDEYPYYYASMKPFLAVDGVRERLGNLVHGGDKWWEYNSPDSLEKTLMDVTKEATTRGIYLIMDAHASRLDSELISWKNIYDEWQQAEAESKNLKLGEKFNLAEEKTALNYITDNLKSATFDKFMGANIRGYYETDPNWLSQHTFIMAKILNLPNIDHIVEEEPKVHEVEGDELHVLIRRIPNYRYMLRLTELQDRKKFYAFFKALAIMEAFAGGVDQFESSDYYWG